MRNFWLIGLIAAMGNTAYGEQLPVESASFLGKHCVQCHGPKKQSGKFRVDALTGDFRKETDHWQAILERLAIGDMPPREQPRPKIEEQNRFVAWIDANLRKAGGVSTITQDLLFPQKGNSVDHDVLFGDTKGRIPASQPRVWRLSPFAYRGLVDGLTHGQVKTEKGDRPLIPAPFGLVTEHGFRDYAFRYKAGSSEAEQLATNAKQAIELMLKKRPGKGVAVPKEVLLIDQGTTPPNRVQLEAAVKAMFRKVLLRIPTDEELERYSQFAQRSIEQLGNHQGLVRGLTPVFMHPEAVFRLELGAGTPDQYGRVLLAPRELAQAIAYALTDNPPDGTLLEAAEQGKLANTAGIREQVARLLNDPVLARPRILRFFQEYFGYLDASTVFKDDHVIKAARVGDFRPHIVGRLIHDTDQLILTIVNEDKDVLRELLTTPRTYVYRNGARLWDMQQKKREDAARKKDQPPPTHPFNGDNRLNEFYNLPAEQWTAKGTMSLPPEQRAGILTQPSWLIAFSTNTDNHAILRGKWIRERLLGGQIPDTPITVDAQMPDEPDKTLRHRMRVTREAYCWKCHERMDHFNLTGSLQSVDRRGPLVELVA